MASSSSNPPSTSASASDPLVSLHNLSALGQRMDSLRRFLSDSLEGRAAPIAANQLQIVSSEISSTVQHVILNATALLASATSHSLFSHPDPDPGAPVQPSNRKENPPPFSMADQVAVDAVADDDDDLDALTQENQFMTKEENENLSDCEIIEMEAEELLTEHVHACEICGKSFKRDANLRMHMRAHGNQFKTLEALSRPGGPTNTAGKKLRFSCPYQGCNRNQAHKRFRPLKSAICLRNHYKRSHCPKLYTCQRCNKKSFSVLADLKSHLRHCGDTPWRCSCGTTFSRKDKLFGHLALFEGHKPDIGSNVEQKKGKDKEIEMDQGMGEASQKAVYDPAFIDGFMDEFEAMEGINCWQDGYPFGGRA
ncbi:C2H2-like zinc finger protein [Rhynchospora pubera]|uniref:C2H2-like zinc finger protein n=1 Tax=Rhynchospora pubera TaxID=906938 RepID=A0AAV8HD31_9POAL|nr:C2H2-like zinc finger protein [Rhynchospora pubera]